MNERQQLIIAVPSIFSLRKQDIKTIVLGSNGLWENTTNVLKEVAEEDMELNELKSKSEKLLENSICKNPKEGEKGLQNMAILTIDLKH